MDKNDRFLKMVNEGKHYDEIAKEFSVTKRTIRNWAINNNVLVERKVTRKVFFDFDYFKKIDSEDKAYILGFISADGYIDMKGNSLNVTVSEKDIYILELISNALGFTGNIRKELRNRVTISFCSKSMVSDLSKYGIAQNKTKTVFIPRIQERLKKHFLRGYFDGDGYVGERQAVLVTSSNVFEDQLMEYIKKHELGSPTLSNLTENSKRFVFSRKDTNFLKHIYENSKVYMPRKKESYDKNWRPYWKQKDARDKEPLR